MSSSSERPALPPEPVRNTSLWERWLQTYARGDSVSAVFMLAGFGLLLLCLIGWLFVAFGLLSSSIRPLITAVECLGFLSLLVGGLRTISWYQPWWTRPFVALFLVSAYLYIVFGLLSFPPTTPLQRTLYATSNLLLPVAVISGLLAAVVWLFARLLEKRARHVEAESAE